jgi:DNA-binding NarL/FixJ family response regulator
MVANCQIQSLGAFGDTNDPVDFAGKMNTQKARLAIIDSDEIWRAGLRSLFQRDSSITVIAELSDADALSSVVADYKPEVLLIGVRRINMSTVNMVSNIRKEWPTLPMVVAGDSDTIPLISALYERGVQAHVDKKTPFAELARTIKSSIAGEITFAPGIAEKIAIYHTSGAKHLDPRSVLSEKEFTIFVMTAQGRAVPEIAAATDLSEKSVRNRVITIRHRLNIERADFRAVADSYSLLPE